ncbi:PCMT-domain-containing protein [Nemania diffusa]|nr:PCMT-domain-containing protein [Nemania diffusa]
MKLITRPIVRLPFLKVDRGYYAPGNAYDDRPQFPSHQLLLPYLVPKIEQPIDSDEAVIGSGSGFLDPLFAELAGETSIIVGVDHVEELRKLGETNMRKSVDGWSEASNNSSLCSDDGDWDVIHVGAAVVRLHDELVRQLRSPGRLFIPIADVENNSSSDQYIWTVEKDEDGNVTKTKLCQAQCVSRMDALSVILDGFL